MDKKSIGTFIAALRKSQGMTQQEVADRLNVSNKTVSKWERDDGYPEVTMIPAIAELFNVTADEILRGERIKEELNPEKSASKVEKQIHFLLNRAMTKFKNLTFVAMALIFAGLNSMFTISYAVYRPLIGFGVMLGLVVAGCFTELIAINGLHSTFRDNELVEQEHYISMVPQLYRYALWAFSLVILTIVLSLPLVVYRDPYYVNSVLRFGKYLTILPWLLLLAGVLVGLGNAIARKSLPSMIPSVSDTHRAKLKAMKKRYILIMVVALGLTIAAQAVANSGINLSLRQRFATLGEMEEFAHEAEKYQRSKEAALRNGYTMLREDEIHPGQRRVFKIQPKYEDISKYDSVKLQVHYKRTILAPWKDAVPVVFGWIYLAEVVLVGAFYFRKRARLLGA